MSDQVISKHMLMRLFLPFGLGYFVSYLFRTVNAVIAPDLVSDLGLSPADLGLLTSTYFITFAAFQLPLGVLLDHFGARRVETGLLLIAAAGALIFALAESMTGVMIGRALIGLGVSACLMAAFKSFVSWLPQEKLPLANGVQMVSGGLGALTATTPVQSALLMTDWRGVFYGLAGISLIVAIIVFLVVPDQPKIGSPETVKEQLTGLRCILTHRFFWQIAPWAVATQATYLSIQGLWSGPWLRDVAGLTRDAVAQRLWWIAIAMIAGYFLFGSAAERLARRGIKPSVVACIGMMTFMIVQLLLVLIPDYAVLLWVLFGFFGAAGILPYAILSQAFPSYLAGRCNTSLNLLVFVSAFAAQWLIGAVIGYWPLNAIGGYDPAGYQAAFLLLIVCQGAGALWYWVSNRVPQ